MRFGRLVACGVLASVLLASSGCQTEPRTEAKAEALAANVQSTLASFKSQDPSLQELLDKSVGVAVFPNIGKAGWVLGGSYGRGEVWERGQHIGWADVSEVTAGFQWGAQSFSQILVFMTQEKLDEFKAGKLALTANVSAVALTAGAAATSDPSKGVVALVDTRGGLMAEAAIGGQRMRFSPIR
jgi:lipid-binding SYLF domain-containing protein